jgi:predicted nuclease of predicted toxin-antitoxin system
MKVLVDECAPTALKHALVALGYESFTVQEVGWSGKANGELLGLAETNFDVLVTLDTNISYQQNLAVRKISILILRSRSNRLKDLTPYFPAVATSLQLIKPGEICFVGIKP